MLRKLLLLLIFAPILMISQERNKPLYTISGKIVDENTQKPLEDATIVFKNIKSDSIRFGGISDEVGNFSFQVSKGVYDVSVEYFSYVSKKLSISAITRDFNVGIIELEIDINYLNEVKVIAEKKAVKIKPNKLEYNVEKDISTPGKYAADILNNIPSVSVDPEGNISLLGQVSVTIMINGKISLLSTYNALKSLPAGSIEKIEIITNPGAKYKASGIGIINIILKKGTNDGLNASVTNSIGYKDYYGGLLTLNHKSNKINFYTNSTYFHRNPIKISSSENEYFNNISATNFVNEYSVNNKDGKGFYSTIGLDIYINPKSTLSGSINYQNINNNNNSRTFTDFLNNNMVSTSTNDRTHISLFDDEILEFTVEFEHNFEKEGRKLSSYVTFLKDVETFDNHITNTNSDFTDEEYIEKNKLENVIVDVKFSNPIGENSNYDIGYYGEFGKIPFTISKNVLNNDIDYNDNIHALFAEYVNRREKWNYKVGLRAEFSESKLNYLSMNTTQTKSYDELFPSFSINYRVNDFQDISFSFSNHINLPNYLRLQPYEQKISETSSYVGNEQLNPIYISALNLSYVFKKNNITFSPSLFYNIYDDYWQDVTYETGELINGVEKIITTPFNVGKVDYYGLNITTLIKPNKILSFTGNLLLYYFDQSGTIEITNSTNRSILKDYNHNSFNGSYNLLTLVTIKNVIDIQTNITHKMISKGPFSTLKNYTYASFSVNKDLFDNDASIGLTIDDVFKSNHIRRDRFDTNYFSKSVIEPKNRTIILSFTYRFNQSKMERKIDFDKKINDSNY